MCGRYGRRGDKQRIAGRTALKGAPLWCGDGDRMANGLLTLIQLDADTMAFTSLLVSIVGAVAAIFAAFYANVAAFYAKKAAAKRDLSLAEPKTQNAEHFNSKDLGFNTPMQPEEKQETSEARPQQEPLQAQVEENTSPAQLEAPISQAQREPSQAQVEWKAQQVHSQQELGGQKFLALVIQKH